MKKPKVKYITGKNIKDVTVLPNFILKLMGRIDAHKGEDVALAHIDRYLKKCLSIESGECLISEEALKNARSEGAANLDIVENTAKEIPDMPGDIEAEHTWEVLENRRRAGNKARAKEAVKTARSLKKTYSFLSIIQNKAVGFARQPAALLGWCIRQI